MRYRIFKPLSIMISGIFLLLVIKDLFFNDPFKHGKAESIILYILAFILIIGWLIEYRKNKASNNRTETLGKSMD